MKVQKLSLAFALLFGMMGVFLIGKKIKSYEKDLNLSYKPTLVVVALQDIKKGETIVENSIKAQEIPQKLVTRDMFTEENFSSLFGRATVKEIKEGEIILEGFLIKEGRKSSKNERLVPLDENLSKLALPFSNGDRIDVILTYKSGQGSITKTMLQDVGVKRSENQTISISDEQLLGTVIFLSMSAYESEIFSHIIDKGKISFVLRNSEENDNSLPTVDDKIIYGAKNAPFEILSSTF